MRNFEGPSACLGWIEERFRHGSLLVTFNVNLSSFCPFFSSDLAHILDCRNFKMCIFPYCRRLGMTCCLYPTLRFSYHNNPSKHCFLRLINCCCRSWNVTRNTCVLAPMIPQHLAGFDKRVSYYQVLNPNVWQRRLLLIVSPISVTDSGSMQSGNATHSNSLPHLWVRAYLLVNLNTNIIIFRL